MQLLYYCGSVEWWCPEKEKIIYTQKPTFKNMTRTCKERECKQEKNLEGSNRKKCLSMHIG
jgi:hypothetical protein